jgi:Zn-dependent oligopeptidase
VTKFRPIDFSLALTHIIQHLADVIQKPPQKHDEELKKLELKRKTGFLTKSRAWDCSESEQKSRAAKLSIEEQAAQELKTGLARYPDEETPTEL